MSQASDGDGPESLSPRDGRRRVLVAVLGATFLALVVRLVGLGTRVMHWDEARVGYWILRYHDSGQYAYRPIVHGPFLAIVNDWVFTVVPPTDFSTRLVVALVGGLLPLSAWLLRDRLRDREVVALALLLAANPLLVYYSRFMRNDVLVAAFSFVAFALAVRAVDASDVRYVYAAVFALALAFTTKENALLYVVSFLGAGALLVDHRLVHETRRGRPAVAVVAGWRVALSRRVSRWGDRGGGDLRAGLSRGVVHAAGALALFLAVVVFFYAPRPDLWQALGAPSSLPGVVETATVGSAEKFYGTWAKGHHQAHDYLPFLYAFLETLLFTAPAVLGFAVVGFIADGYRDGGSRAVVAFATYWGVASVVGYPIATDIPAPWTVVHAVVPLAVPAAVGGAYLYDRARVLRERATADALSTPPVSAVVATLLLVAAVSGVVSANAVYMNSASEETKQIGQWAQPENDLKATLEEVRLVARSHDDGPDVLFFGTCPPGGCDGRGDKLFYVANESSTLQPPPGGPNWHSRLPFPWYLERYGATVTSTPPDDPTLPDDPPPVIVAYDWNRSDVDRQVSGYVVHRHAFKLWGEHIVVFVDQDALREARATQS